MNGSPTRASAGGQASAAVDQAPEIAWDDLDVAVVGGGPAGLAVAIALLTVSPTIKLKVFEAAPTFTPQGAGVLLNINGARALEAIHPTILHTLVADATVMSGMYTYDDTSGDRMPWVQGANHTAALAAGGYSPCLVQWSDIRDSLYGMLPPGVVEFGCKVTACTPPPPAPASGPEAKGEGGGGGEDDPDCFVLDVLRPEQAAHGGGQHERRLAARARHVVAADGFFSRVRRTAGDAQAPAFRNRLMWRGSLTWEELQQGRVPVPPFLQPPEALLSTHVWMPVTPGAPPSGPPERIVVLYPAGTGRLVWSLFAPVARLQAAGEAYPRPAEGAEEGAGAAAAGAEANEGKSTHQAGTWGAASLRRGLAAFPQLPEPLRAMLAATPPERVTEHGYYGHEVAGMVQGAWAQGRLVLVGDAAHSAPPDGQGANLALEDAAELGACVRAHGLGPQAFAAWEALRQPRIRAILGDATPGATVRTPLIAAAAFEPLWSPRQLAEAGALPEGVAAQARAEGAGAEGAEAEAAGVKAVLEWSRGVVRGALEKKLEGRVLPEVVPNPGGWRFR